jgi:hypothetical protein
MSLTTRVSSFLEAAYGSSIGINQSYSVADSANSKYFHPLEFTMNALATVTGNLCNITTVKYLMLESSLPVDVTIVTPTGPALPPTPTPATFRVNNVMTIGADIANPIIFFNPNSGATGNVSVKITAIGA